MDFYNVFYWLTVADGVKEVFDTASNFFTFLTAISLIAFVIVTGFSMDASAMKNDGPSVLAWRKFFFRVYMFCQIVCIITWLGYVATPTKKDCLLIVAGGAVGNFITTDSSSKALPADVTRYLHLSLNKEIQELSTSTQADIKKELGIQTPKEKLLNNLGTMTKEQIISYLEKDSTVFNTK